MSGNFGAASFKLPACSMPVSYNHVSPLAVFTFGGRITSKAPNKVLAVDFRLAQPWIDFSDMRALIKAMGMFRDLV